MQSARALELNSDSNQKQMKYHLNGQLGDDETTDAPFARFARLDLCANALTVSGR